MEIEAVINSRPLTYYSVEDPDEPLTPSHILCGRRILRLPDGLHEEDVDKEFTLPRLELSRHLRDLNAVLNQVWKRWRGEYLLELVCQDQQPQHEEDETESVPTNATGSHPVRPQLAAAVVVRD